MLPSFLRSVVPALGLLVVAAPAVAGFQYDPGAFPPATLDSLAEAARDAPLFASDEPLELTLRTRLDYLEDERPDEEEVEGFLHVRRADGGVDTVEVEVRARGNFRREKRNCSFPPLRLDLPRSRVAGTAFENQDKLKLVTPCRLGRDDYQEYVLQEYMAYRVYNLVTPMSYRVRPVALTMEDVDGRFETRQVLGFLIEADIEMAHRNRAFLAEFDQWHPRAVDEDDAARMALFQYMIGNTDWSQPFFHNTDMVRTWEGGRYVPVPYDFDFTGVVNARYADPPEELGIRNVRERVYRGFCYTGTDHQAHRRFFQDLEAPVAALYRESSVLTPDLREDALDYYEDFFRTLANDGRYRRLVEESCMTLPG